MDVLVYGGGNQHQEFVDPVFEELLPLSSIQKFKEFEELLEEEETKKKLKFLVVREGGGMSKIAVTNALVMLFSNAVAKEVNWEGVPRKGIAKLPFKPTNISKILFG